MDTSEQIKLEVMFDSKTYGAVGCNINIIDGVALARFSDVRLARDMYNAEKKLGNDVYFKERLSTYGEKFPGKTKEEIAKDIIKKFEEHNIKVLEKKK